MAETALISAATRAAFEQIVDYAGLFPPAHLSMPEAAAEYARERDGAHAWMLGRFVVPTGRIAELERQIEDSDPFRLAVLLNTSDDVAQTPRTRPEACEIAVRLDGEAGSARAAIAEVRKRVATLASLPVSVEVPSRLERSQLREVMRALAGAGFAAKIRCGGVSPDATPPVEAVSAFITEAVGALVPFKATAGLHHPIRHLNANTGTMVHGFVNVLAAACFASEGEKTVETIVSETDAEAFRFEHDSFRWRGLVADLKRLRDVRSNVFRSFGSCSFHEPVDDLIALGILARA
jgi:hypothetical protein